MKPEEYAVGISQIINLAYNDIKAGLDKGAVKVREFLEIGVEKYLIRESHRFSTSKTFLHRSSPVNFYEVFEPPLIRPQLEVRKVSTATPSRMLNGRPKMTITGEAGSGKSTLLKHLFLSVIKDKKFIPIFIELRFLNEAHKTIVSTIEDIFDKRKIAAGGESVDVLLAKGRIVLFFDGIDELEHGKKLEILNEISELSIIYPDCGMIASSRPHEAIELLPKFSNFVILPFEEAKVISFIRRQKLEEELQAKLLKSIKSSIEGDFGGFLSNPLLLSLYILTFNTYASIPKSKSTFYRRVFDTLFAEHDSLSKLGYERAKRSGLSQEQFEHVLERFSFVTYMKSEFVFNKDTLSIYFRSLKCDPTSPTYLQEKIIEDLVLAIGIWVEDSGLFQFTHRSLQEYFAAAYLRSLETSNKEKVYEKLRNKTKGHSHELGNFIGLCQEMDERNFLELYKIPLLKNIKTDILFEEPYSSEKAIFGGFVKWIRYREMRSNGSPILHVESGEILGHVDFLSRINTTEMISYLCVLRGEWPDYVRLRKFDDPCEGEEDNIPGAVYSVDFRSRFDDRELFEFLAKGGAMKELGEKLKLGIDEALEESKQRADALKASVATVLDFM